MDEYLYRTVHALCIPKTCNFVHINDYTCISCAFLRVALKMNVVGVKEMISLCKGIKNLKVGAVLASIRL